eukprot:1161263-Pelagomonas_calceolata.AAC.9
MHYKYVEYRPYWVEGLPEGVEELLAAADTGLQLRGVIWAHVTPPPEPPEPQVSAGLEVQHVHHIITRVQTKKGADKRTGVAPPPEPLKPHVGVGTESCSRNQGQKQ